jgi:hypothetical protein
MTVLLDERSDLRKELQFLKECQFKYFSMAVTVSGVLIGIAHHFHPPEVANREVLLAPLLVVLPCWLIFFDKATTITRMVGYLTVLEKIIITPGSYRYIGWENAVFFARAAASAPGVWSRLQAHGRGLKQGLKLLLYLRSAHRYWLFTWLTFGSLGVVSLWLSANTTVSTLHRVSIGLVVFTSIYTLLLLVNLVGGKYSYDAARARWEVILK